MMKNNHKHLTFYLLRHGRTVWNEQGLLQGHSDSPLTEKGIADAQLTGKALAHIPFIAGYSSCLKRSIDTASLILSENFVKPIPHFQHQGLNEQYFGQWEGKRVDDLRQLPQYQNMKQYPERYDASENGGESYAAMATRVLAAMQDIINVHQQGNILIVAHGHSLRLLTALLNGATWQNYLAQSVSLANCGICVFEYRQEEREKKGAFHLLKLNDTSHLAIK